MQSPMTELAYGMKDHENTHNSPQSSFKARGGELGNAANDGTWSALSLAWELGYTIAVPLVVLVLGGRWLDRRLDTSPWLLLVGVFISIPISTVVIYVKMMKIIDRK